MERRRALQIASGLGLIGACAACETRAPGQVPPAFEQDGAIAMSPGSSPEPPGGAIESSGVPSGGAGQNADAGVQQASGSGGIVGFTGSGGTGFSGIQMSPGFTGTGGTGFSGQGGVPGFTGTGGTGFNFIGSGGAGAFDAGTSGGNNTTSGATTMGASRAASSDVGFVSPRAIQAANGTGGSDAGENR